MGSSVQWREDAAGFRGGRGRLQVHDTGDLGVVVSGGGPCGSGLRGSGWDHNRFRDHYFVRYGSDEVRVNGAEYTCNLRTRLKGVLPSGTHTIPYHFVQTHT